MPAYRIYFIGTDDHFGAAETIDCMTDDQAMERALERIGHFSAVEVWCGSRSLGRIAPDDGWPG